MIHKSFALFFACLLATNFLLAQETEEVISVGSYIESREANASPVDVISNEEFKQFSSLTGQDGT